jgi:soluble lytic murein transglycosylase
VRRRWIWFLLLLILIDGIFYSWWSWRDRESRYDKRIAQTAAQYNVDPALVKAVIWRESNFNPKAVGTVGEIGLMQLRSLVAKEWAQDEGRPAILHEHLFDPARNIEVGTWYLAKLIKRYRHTDNPTAYALADYNAGRSNVLKWMQGKGKTQSEEFLAQMSFPATQQYIQAIQKRQQHYQSSFERRLEGK